MAEFTKGEWRDKLSATGERVIYVEDEDGIEIICRDIRHWNIPIVKSSPAMYEALNKTVLQHGYMYQEDLEIARKLIKGIKEKRK
uniref:Uncharacterized protein n=1 Tax=viral metagenome TaxID=1070528 RepID=A0A6M3LUL7_9ZZZZ